MDARNEAFGSASRDESMSVPQEWPAHFPDCCPPSDASDLDCTVYYLVSKNPPEHSCFLSAKERDAFKGKNECERASLSCGISLEYISALRDSTPRLMEHYIAAARLRPSDGRFSQTGKPGHHSMWLRSASLDQAPIKFTVIP